MKRLAVFTLFAVATLSAAFAANEFGGGGGIGVAGGRLPLTTGLGLGPRSPVGNAVGSVAGTAAQDQMRGANGGKCRQERRVGGSIPEC